MLRLIDRLSMFDRRSNSMANDEEIAHSGLLVAPRSPTLGELLQHVGNSRHYDGGGGTPDSQILDLDGMTTIDRGPVPFVLTFTDLTYRIKNPRNISPSEIFRRRRSNRLATADIPAETEVEPKASAVVPGRSKTLLDGISGEARDGEILAVLGASGSGKSTLIDALANRISKDSLKGSVTLNGARLESRLLKTISAYVMQDDLLYPMLTVEETLTFAAEFRLPRSLPPSRKKARVQALIDQLGLRAAAQTIIGDEGHRGVSGGERRRVSIGTDIIHDPIILFLDEPTSGLDSTSAFMVVKVLQRIARSGSIVVMSIHQPSSRIISLLDRVLFLSRGQTIYSGSPDGLPLFFADAGYPIPEKESRTEFALDLIRELESSIPSGTKPLVDLNRSRQQPMELHTNESPFSAQSLKDAISASISRGKLVSGAPDGTVTVSSSSVPMFANPFWVEVAVLARRSFTNSRRQPKILSIRLASVMVTGFILATIFWHVDNSPRGMRERLGFFAFGMSTMFYSCADALPVFIQERYIFMRETAYNAYRRSSYVLANAAVGFPPLVALTVGFTVTTFFAVGLAGGATGFFFYFLIVLASFWAGSGFVTFLSATVSHVMLGYVMVVAILAYFLLFSGFFIQRDRIPDYWIWFHYLSLVKYPFEAVLQNEFGNSGKCFSRGVELFDNTPLASVPSALKASVLKSISGSLGVEITAETCLTTGADILKNQGITQLSKWNCLLVTVAWGFLYRFLFYFALLLGSKNKRT